jgi:2,4-dienoyl-CoA reductase-like NADH-dependent reductase (Old Yellow Enzyme family)
MNSSWKGGKRVEESNGGWTAQAPSAIPYNEEYSFPEAMSQEDIIQVVKDFKSSAIRALEAGFEVLEIHGAHGYLIHSFLSPLSNSRKDQYGGSFENRTRFLIEIINGIRTVWPERLPLFLRISATDYLPDGWDLESSIRLAALIKEMGVDLIDCSSGGLLPNVRIPLGPGYQVSFSESIRKKTGMLTGAVGLITTATQANEIIMTGKADMILIARESLRNPNFPLTAAKELGKEIEWPLQYLRAR